MATDWATGPIHNATGAPRKYLPPTVNADWKNSPGWSWDPFADLWEEGFRRLVQYVERTGNALVQVAYTTDDGYKLGQWVKVQRREHSNGALDADRERRVEGLNGWTWDTLDERPAQGHGSR